MGGGGRFRATLEYLQVDLADEPAVGGGRGAHRRGGDGCADGAAMGPPTRATTIAHSTPASTRRFLIDGWRGMQASPFADRAAPVGSPPGKVLARRVLSDTPNEEKIERGEQEREIAAGADVCPSPRA